MSLLRWRLDLRNWWCVIIRWWCYWCIKKHVCLRRILIKYSHNAFLLSYFHYKIAIITFVTLEKPTDKFSNLRLYKLCWTAWYCSSLCEYDKLITKYTNFARNYLTSQWNCSCDSNGCRINFNIMGFLSDLINSLYPKKMSF